MTIALADNPAITDPHKALTRKQQEALSAIDFFRLQKRGKSSWAIGPKRFPAITIDRLAEQGLVKCGARNLSVTQAGKLALDKLKGNRP